MRTLNLGAGNKILRHGVNHDRVAHRPEIDVVWDLNILPWPWEDSTFDQVLAHAVLEHLDIDLVQSVDECWRILRPDGVLKLKLPYWRSDLAHADPTHRWFFSVRSLDIFMPETARGRSCGFYTTRKWTEVHAARLNEGRTSITATMRVLK